MPEATDKWQPSPWRLEMLNDIATKLNEANDITDAMEAILPRLGEVLNSSTAWAFRYDPQRKSFVEVGASGLPPALSCDNASTLKTGWCECQDQFVEGKLNTAVNIVRCSRLRDALGDTQDLSHHASIPLRSKGKPLGILNVATAGHSVFTNEALSLLSTIGKQVAIAVDRAGLLAAERHRAQQLKSLSNMAAELVTVVDPGQILQFAVTQFVHALNYEACAIVSTVLDDTDRKSYKILSQATQSADAWEHQEYSYDDETITPLLPVEQRVLLSETRSFMEQPIPHTEYLIRLESAQSLAFHDVDQDLLSAFAGHMAAALENARLYQQSMQNATWAERRRLAANLHDSVSQRLFSAVLLAKSAHLMVREGHDSSSVSGVIEKVQQLIASGQEEMKALIQTLRPADDKSFVARLRERVEPLQLQSQTRLQLCIESGESVVLTFEEREALLHVIDESLQNVFKHAKAKNVYVTMILSDKVLTLSVRDDGIGFDESQITKGMGTTTMYDRMRSIGGKLHIHSTVEHGTTVLCELPTA